MKFLNGFLTLALATLCHGSIKGFSLRPRIVQGSTAGQNQYPYMAAVGLGYYANNNQFIPTSGCGGAILNPYWVLTAGHCIPPDSAGSTMFKISVGTNTENYNDPAFSHQVAQAIMHPAYIDHTDNDIALLQTATPMQFSDIVNAVALPNSDPVKSGVAILAGYGQVQNKPGSSAQYLQYVSVQLHDLGWCNTNLVVKITERQFCTYNSPGQGFCLGDSGGGLVRDGVVIGIVSHLGSPQCAQGSPDVYTNVYSYVNWIRQVTGNAF